VYVKDGLGNLAFPAFLLLFAFSVNFTVSLILTLFIGFSFVWQNALANTLLPGIVLRTPPRFEAPTLPEAPVLAPEEAEPAPEAQGVTS
jgi:hypothetical protein